MKDLLGGGLESRVTKNRPGVLRSFGVRMREGTITNTNWRLLIVDDEPGLLSVMSECLSMQGFDCEVALDGEFATQLLGTQKFDALLIDSLAKNQTLDVIQAFKAAQSHGTVIFFTEK